MTNPSRTLELILERRPRHALPRELYLDEDVFRDDLDQIWHKEWIFACHTVEIKKAGEYVTLQIGDYPVVVIRDDQGNINAFHNSCRHRGSRLCSAENGKSAKLVCPYHKWTYGLDGHLIFAGNMGASFDTSQYGLKTVHCEVVHGFVYVCVAIDPPDFTPFREKVSPFLEPHNLDNCKVAYSSDLVEEGNWKLVFENNRECYHCDHNHPELLNAFVENLSVAGVSENEDPELAAHWDSCEAGGLPSRLVMDDDGRFRMTRIPLAQGAVSYTMDGKPAVNKRLDRSGVDNIGALLYFNYPNTWNHFLGDHALSFRVLPLGAGRTLVTTKWLVPEDAVEGVDYDIDALTQVWLATNSQDKQLVEESYRGVGSPSYTPGPYSGIAENGVCQFVDWYCETIKSRLQKS